MVSNCKYAEKKFGMRYQYVYLSNGFQKLIDFLKNQILLVINKKMIIIIVRLECNLNWSEDTL